MCRMEEDDRAIHHITSVAHHQASPFVAIILNCVYQESDFSCMTITRVHTAHAVCPRLPGKSIKSLFWIKNHIPPVCLYRMSSFPWFKRALKSHQHTETETSKTARGQNCSCSENAFQGCLNHHHHHHLPVKELGHLVTCSGLTHPEVSSVVFLGFFCLLGCSFYQSG
jgi:hypothetical protein